MAKTMAQAAGKFNAVARKIKKCSPGGGFFRILLCARMKAKIVITPKKAVLDPQGKTVQNALEQMGYQGVTGVHIGKYIEIDLAPDADKAAAQRALNDAAHKFLSNPVIEDFKLEIE
jgi:phosphoribosylformylglycinamidine synthase PurS subunit